MSSVEARSSSSKEIIYADIVQAPQSPDNRKDAKPDVLQTQQVIYADLASVNSQSNYYNL